MKARKTRDSLLKTVFFLALVAWTPAVLSQETSHCQQLTSDFSSTNLVVAADETYKIYETKGQAACNTFYDLKNSGFAVSEQTCMQGGPKKVEVVLTPSLTCYRDLRSGTPFYSCEMALSLRDGRFYGTVANPCAAVSIVGVRN